MKYSINAETIVSGTPVGRNCLLQPTQEELDVVWNAMIYVVHKLGQAAEMIEVLQASYHQYEDSRYPYEHGDLSGRYLVAELKAVLVAPHLYPVKKMEASERIDTALLRKDLKSATETFLIRIETEIRRAIENAESSARAMTAML